MMIQLLNGQFNQALSIDLNGQFNQALSIDLISTFQCHRLITHVTITQKQDPEKVKHARIQIASINPSCYC